MQYIRIAVSTAIAVGFLVVDVLMTIHWAVQADLGLVSGEHPLQTQGVAGQGLEGAGLGALLTGLLAFGLADAAGRQWRSEEGARRNAIVALGLLGILWGAVRVALGDPYIIPAVLGCTWLVFQAALFVRGEDPDEEPTEGAV